MRAVTIGVVASTMIALSIIAILSFFVINAEAGVPYGNEYQATLVNVSDVGTSSVKSMAGTIGNIVVASTSGASTAGPYIAFYDTASTTIATTSMTAKLEFGAEGATTPPAGDYTFDVAFGQGIYMWVDPSFNGSYTVTYR